MRLTCQQGEHVGDGQVEEVHVGGRLHVLVVGDHQARADVAHHAAHEDERVEDGHGDDGGQRQVLGTEDLGHVQYAAVARAHQLIHGADEPGARRSAREMKRPRTDPGDAHEPAPVLRCWSSTITPKQRLSYTTSPHIRYMACILCSLCKCYCAETSPDLFCGATV